MREWALIFISGISCQFTTVAFFDEFTTIDTPDLTTTTNAPTTTTTGTTTSVPTTTITTTTGTTTRTFGGTEVAFTTAAFFDEFTTIDTPDLTTIEPATPSTGTTTSVPTTTIPTTTETTTRTFQGTEVAFTTAAVFDEFTTIDTPDLTTTIEPTTTTTGTTTRTFGGTEVAFTTAAVFDEFTTMDNLDTTTTLATTTSTGLGSTVGFTTDVVPDDEFTTSGGLGGAPGTTEMIYTTMLPTTTTTQITTTTTELLTTTTSSASTIATDTTSTTFPEFDTDTTTAVNGDAGATGIDQYAPGANAGEQVSMMPYGDDDQAVAGAYGDPHFMVRSEHGEPICFDYNPLLASNNMLLLTDPRTSLTVLAKPEERGDTGRLFMSELTIMTPNAVTLTINSAGIFLDGEIVSEVGAKSGIHVTSDLTFRTTWAKDGNHEHTNVEIEDGPIFLIKGNLKKESLSFAIMDASGISRKAKGIIGGFIADDSYIIHKSNDTPTLGVVQAGKNYASTELKHYHREEKCWVIDEEDALRMISKV
ncbi:Oidioi.mRNA.OKI2018_I69.chr1.g2830.t1.cds [Oikopleura dioica]|uniref:Oidioi.mRNA.OKI2018_I69.chr1.g2830.t1.cds n=1 Tax=Oikopleura dioica TaxID=34765 RepID=A0ABN7SXQ3_OIKDI|nr:Oidioi.mRNA.OKI2018_I69.chr1.g2830.t1.cds [Oikopleura dioica]